MSTAWRNAWRELSFAIGGPSGPAHLIWLVEAPGADKPSALRQLRMPEDAPRPPEPGEGRGMAQLTNCRHARNDPGEMLQAPAPQPSPPGRLQTWPRWWDLQRLTWCTSEGSRHLHWAACRGAAAGGAGTRNVPVPPHLPP
jgi:hypothetical protein